MVNVRATIARALQLEEVVPPLATMLLEIAKSLSHGAHFRLGICLSARTGG
jgi:hypothetical protein